MLLSYDSDMLNELKIILKSYISIEHTTFMIKNQLFFNIFNYK